MGKYFLLGVQVGWSCPWKKIILIFLFRLEIWKVWHKYESAGSPYPLSLHWISRSPSQSLNSLSDFNSLFAIVNLKKFGIWWFLGYHLILFFRWPRERGLNMLYMLQRISAVGTFKKLEAATMKTRTYWSPATGCTSEPLISRGRKKPSLTFLAKPPMVEIKMFCIVLSYVHFWVWAFAPSCSLWHAFNVQCVRMHRYF